MMNSLGACTLALISGLAVAQTEPHIEQISARLTPNDLKADVSFLASDLLQGRATPSHGLDIAAEYIAAQFRRAGLEPAGDDGYFQTAPYENVTPKVEGMALTLEMAGVTIKADPESMAMQQVFAADFSRVGLRKVRVANGASLGAVLPDQARGKVLVLDFANPKMLMPTMLELAVLANRVQPVLVVVLRASGLPRNMAAGLREIPYASSTPVILVWDDAIRVALSSEEANLADATISIHVPPPTVAQLKLRNVVGVLRGSDPTLRNTYVLVTAHYDHLGVCGIGDGDHICNGANDDASGTASVIEIANTLSAQSVRPKRSIVFMTFFGEELGLLGSRYYATHPIFPPEETVADVNLEQLGRTDVDGASSVGLLNVTGYDFSTLTDVLRKTGEAAGVQVVKNEQMNVRYFGGSDNQALAELGVPAHTLSVGYAFPDYHKPGDKWPKLDYNNLAKVDLAVALAVFRVANSVETPQWNRDIPNTQSYVKARQDSLSKP